MHAGSQHVVVLWIALAGIGGCTTTRKPPEISTSALLSRARAQRPDMGSVQPVSYEAPEEEEPGFTWSDLSPSKLAQTVKNAAGYGPDPEKARAAFAEAEALYRQAAQIPPGQNDAERRNLFVAASEQYKTAADRYPDSDFEQDAFFKAGESRFFADHYPQANQFYEKLLKKYPNSRHLDTVEARRFVIAQYWLELNRAEPQPFWSFNWTNRHRPVRDSFGHAVRIYDKIRTEDPTGKLADDATLAMGNAYFTAGKFDSADEAYSDLRRTFPSSEHQFRAHLLGLKAKLESYAGPDYPSTTLDEAEKLIVQIRKQFPKEAQDEVEYLTRAYREVRYKKAEEQWSMARYFDQRGQYGAARHYYDIILNEYHDVTPMVERADTRLAEIEGRPVSPPQRLSWLADLFPDSEPARPLITAGASGSYRR